MPAMTARFADILTQAVHLLASREKRTISAIHDELGYQIGRETGGSVIDYWRRGNVPTKVEELEKLTDILVKRQALDKASCQQFLKAADYINADQLIRRLFPEGPASFNHFVAGPPILSPRQFFGREHLLKRIFDTWCGFPLEHFAIIGPKRSGKTSLLYQLMKITTANETEIRPNQRTNYLSEPELFQWALVNFQDSRRRDQTKLFRFILTELDMPVPDECDQDNFLDVLGQHLKSPTVILLDELQAGLADARLDEDFWWCLRAASQNSEGQLAFVLTTTKAPVELAADEHKPSPFFNIFHTLTLEPFTELEARTLMGTSPIAFASNNADWILEQSDGWPALLQILCKTYLHALKNEIVEPSWQEEGLRQIEPYLYLLAKNQKEVATL